VQHLTLETRVARLEDDPPIRLDSLDLAFGDPEPLRRTFEETFAFIATVEGAVTRNVAEITTLLPDLDDLDLRFLSAWSTQELAHAAVFDALRSELGLLPAGGPLPASGTDRDAPAGAAPARPKLSFRVAGVLAASGWLQDVVKLIYLSRGAMHEHLTYDAYRHLGARFAALGEDGLVTTVTEPIRRQEAAHLGYYRLAAATHRGRLSAAQVALARWITVHTYTPVGAAPCGNGPTGRVFTGLAGDDVDAVLDAVEAVADQLLGDGVRTLPRFAHAAMDECLRRPSRNRPWRSARETVAWR
jgi:hypothetical protein